jgi:hypothetical protein
VEDGFKWLEVQVVEIGRNMNLLMVALEINLGLFGDDGGSNSERKLEGKSEDREESGEDLRKEYEKE